MLWVRIAKEMASRGFSVTTAQCDNKYKALKEFTSRLSTTTTIQAVTEKLVNFMKIDRLYGYKVSTRPVYTLGTVKTTKKDSPETQTSKREFQEESSAEEN